jgi:squalene-associated FAD-dependent desaturase
VRVAIIGAGLAGLACGCELAEAGHVVTLFERRPWVGGRAYSYVDETVGAEVDNGQHVFMACTTAYVDFLGRLGTLALTQRQQRFRMAVYDQDGARSELRAARLPAPLHALPSFLAYRHLSFPDKLRVLRAFLQIHRLPPARAAEIRDVAFADWLRRRGQSEAAIRGFWDLIVRPTLNCTSAEASAALALFVFQEGLLPSSRAAAIGIPRVGLSRLHGEPAVRYIEARGGTVHCRVAVEALVCSDDTVGGLVLASGEQPAFDAYVCALPPKATLGLVPPALRERPPFAALAAFRTSPIVNLHLWFDGPVADFDFAAFVGCDLQWIFNRSRIVGEKGDREHLVVSLSAADQPLAESGRGLVDLDRGELIDLLLPQIQRALPKSRGRHLLQATVIKEPQATFRAVTGLRRPGPETPLANLFLAGAYTDTGWPATMESAVRSGLAAARAVQTRQGRLEAALVS